MLREAEVGGDQKRTKWGQIKTGENSTSAIAR